MKKIILSISILLLITTQSINAQLKCPVEALGVKYDKNSPFGKEICGALSNLNNLSEELGKNYNSSVNNVTRNIDLFIEDITKNAINKKASIDFAVAKAKFKSISDRIDRLVKDPQCGAPGVYKGMVTLFVNTGQTIKDLQEIGTSSFAALQEINPIAGRVFDIGKDLTNIATIVAGKSPEIDAKLTKLINIVKSLEKDLRNLANLDFTSFASSLTALASNVGPFLTDCASCAGTIGASLTGIAAGAGETTVGVAGSETAVPAIFIPVGGATAGVSSFFGKIMADQACKGVVEKSALIDSYINDISKFIKATGDLAERISSNTKKVIETTSALAELGQAIGEASKPSIKNIQNNLVLISEDLKRAVGSFNKNVKPKIENLSVNTLTELSKNTKQLYQCYQKYSSVSSLITQDLIDAAVNLSSALAQISGAQQLYNELTENLEKARNSIVKDVKEDWEQMDKQRDRFMKKLLGDKPSDAGAVAGHLLSLATDFDSAREMISDLNKLAVKAGKFATTSVEAAFKTLPSETEIKRVLTAMQLKYDNAFAKIAEAENKMRAQNRTAGL